MVAAGLATKCEIQLAYVIGVAEPVSLLAESFGTASIDDTALSAIVRDVFDFRPASIAARLNLLQPITPQPQQVATSVALQGPMNIPMGGP